MNSNTIKSHISNLIANYFRFNTTGDITDATFRSAFDDVSTLILDYVDEAYTSTSASSSNNYDLLINKPTFKTINNIPITGSGNIEITGSLYSGSSFDGNYNSLTNKPTIPTLLSSLTGSANYRTVSDTEKSTWNAKSSFDGNYNSLTNKPTFKTINNIPITGSGNIEITGSQFSGSSFDGNYNSLTNKPFIPTALSELTGSANYRTVSDTEKSTWNAKSTFDGNYNSLSNKPTIPTLLSDLTGSANYRTVSDTEKSTWNAKSTFDGNYNSLSNKPAIPTLLSDLTGSANYRTITDTQKANIPLNNNTFISFNSASISIDCASTDIYIDTNFIDNIEMTTGNKTITLTNPVINKVNSLLFPKLAATTVIILPTECKKLIGDYSTTLQNVVMIHCVSTSPLLYLYSISQIQA